MSCILLRFCLFVVLALISLKLGPCTDVTLSTSFVFADCVGINLLYNRSLYKCHVFYLGFVCLFVVLALIFFMIRAMHRCHCM